MSSPKAKHLEVKSSYDRDYYAWAVGQAAALRTGRLSDLDLENLGEEVEDLARRVKAELQHRAEVLLAHLLKWRFQPDKRGASCQATIDEQRERICDLIAENPSLAPLVDDTLAQAYRYAKRTAGRQMKLGTAQWERVFPSACPWTSKQVLSPVYLPASIG